MHAPALGLRTYKPTRSECLPWPGHCEKTNCTLPLLRHFSPVKACQAFGCPASNSGVARGKDVPGPFVLTLHISISLMLIKSSSRMSKWEGPAMFITIHTMNHCVEAAFYSCFCKVYSSRLSRSGASEQRVRIQCHSFALRKVASSLWLFSIIQTERSSRE